MLRVREKLKSSADAKIKSKAVRTYDRLIFKKGVLHCLYIHNEVNYHQLMPSIKYRSAGASNVTQWPNSSRYQAYHGFVQGTLLLGYYV